MSFGCSVSTDFPAATAACPTSLPPYKNTGVTITSTIRDVRARGRRWPISSARHEHTTIQPEARWIMLAGTRIHPNWLSVCMCQKPKQRQEAVWLRMLVPELARWQRDTAVLIRRAGKRKRAGARALHTLVCPHGAHCHVGETQATAGLGNTNQLPNVRQAMSGSQLNS